MNYDQGIIEQRNITNIENLIPLDMHIDYMENIIHGRRVSRPKPVNNNQVWYMHPEQQTSFLMIHGYVFLDLFDEENLKTIHFKLTTNGIYKNEHLHHKGRSILCLEQGTFYRMYTTYHSALYTIIKNESFGYDEEENYYVYTLNQYTGEFDIADEKVHY
jgi:hypothetical protein